MQAKWQPKGTMARHMCHNGSFETIEKNAILSRKLPTGRKRRLVKQVPRILCQHPRQANLYRHHDVCTQVSIVHAMLLPPLIRPLQHHGWPPTPSANFGRYIKRRLSCMTAASMARISSRSRANCIDPIVEFPILRLTSRIRKRERELPALGAFAILLVLA